jgi:hypothetical protein
MFLDERGSLGLRVPLDWLPACGDIAQLDREEEWRKWRDNIIAEINEYLWPSWNPKTGKWINCTAKGEMERLTRADLALLGQMAEASSLRGLQALPDSPSVQPEAFSHREMFILEDDRRPDGVSDDHGFASFYKMYDREMPEETAADVRALWFTSVSRKMSKLGHQVKDILQRPRPHQMALLMGDFGFYHEEGRTSQTPSMCSNHCLQGMIGVGGVYEAFRTRKITFNQDALKQFAVDIGDRRVMAGIHYPSDNICSWILVMKLAPQVYRDPTVKKWLWDAIENRSLVYRHIKQFSESTAGAALAGPLKYLQSLA